MSTKKKMGGLKKGLIVSLIGAVVLMSVLFASLLQATPTVDTTNSVSATYVGREDNRSYAWNFTVSNGTGPKTMVLRNVNLTFINRGAAFNPTTCLDTLSTDSLSGVCLYNDTESDGWQGDAGDVLFSTDYAVSSWYTISASEWAVNFTLNESVGNLSILVIVNLTNTAVSGMKFNISLQEGSIGYNYSQEEDNAPMFYDIPTHAGNTSEEIQVDVTLPSVTPQYTVYPTGTDGAGVNFYAKDGDNITLRATATDAHSGLASPGSVKVNVTNLNDTLEWITMYDDGAHGDGSASDSLYGAYVILVNATTGTYANITVNATDAADSIGLGNNYTSSLTVHVDTTAPGALSCVAVNNKTTSPTNISAWTNSPVFFVNWTGVNDSDSGTAGYYYKFGAYPTSWDDIGATGGLASDWNVTVNLSALGISDGNVTMWIWAIDNAHNMGTVSAAQLLWDVTPPNLNNITIKDTDTSSPQCYNWTNSLTVTLEIDVNDTGGSGMSSPARVYFNTDGGTWTEKLYATTVSYAMPSATADGTRIIYMKAKDKAGNENTTAITDTIILDQTAPAIPSNGTAYIDRPGLGFATTGDNVTLWATITDATSGIPLNATGVPYVMINVTALNSSLPAGWVQLVNTTGGNNFTYTMEVNLTTIETDGDGDKWLQINATDNATNQDLNYSILVKIDTSNPVVTANPIVYANFTDALGCTVNCTNATNGNTVTLNVTVWDTGTLRYLMVNVTNITTDSYSGVWVNPPGLGGRWLNLTWSAYKTNTSESYYTNTVTIGNASNGTHLLAVNATDNLNNSISVWPSGSSGWVNITLFVDNIIPNVTNPWVLYNITTTINHTTTGRTSACNGDNVTLNITVQDNRSGSGISKVQVYVADLNSSQTWINMTLSSGDGYDGNWTANVKLLGATNGTKQLQVKAWDNASKYNWTEYIYVTVNNQPRVTANATGYINATYPWVTVACNGTLVNISVMVVDDDVTQVQVFLNDTSTTENRSLTLAGPVWVNLTKCGNNNTWYNNTINVSATGYAMANGTLNLTINATDSAGNWNNTENVTVKIDDQAPSVSNPAVIYITDYGNNGWAKNGTVITINVTVTDNGIAGIHNVTVNASAIGGIVWQTMENTWKGGNNYTVNITVSANTGNYTLNFTVYDNASNVNITTNVTVYVDNEPPQATLSGYYNVTLGTSQLCTNMTNLSSGGWGGANHSVRNNDTVMLFVHVNDSSYAGILYNASGDYWYIMAYVHLINASQYWVEMKNTTADKWNFTVNVTIGETISDGNYTITLNITDNATNRNTTTTWPCNITVWVKGVAPIITGTSAWYYQELPSTFYAVVPGHNVTINATINDGSGCNISWTNGVWVNVGKITGTGTGDNWVAMNHTAWAGGTDPSLNYTVNVSVGSAIATGTYNLTVYATDNASRSSNDSTDASRVWWVLVKVDIDKPEVIPQPTYYQNGSAAAWNDWVNITVTVKELDAALNTTAGVYNVTIDVSAISNNYTSPTDIIGNRSSGTMYEGTYWLNVTVHKGADGIHKIYLNVSDNVGNYRSTVYCIVKIDTGVTLPQISVLNCTTSANNYTAIVGDWLNITVTTATDVVNATVNLELFYNATGVSYGFFAMTQTYTGSGVWYLNFTIYNGSSIAAGAPNNASYSFTVNITDNNNNNATNTSSGINIDAVLPQSDVTQPTSMYWNSTAYNTYSSGIHVVWSCTEWDNFSANLTFDIYRKIGPSGTWVLWTDYSNTNLTCANFTSVEEGQTYYFYSVATDWAGNRENGYVIKATGATVDLVPYARTNVTTSLGDYVVGSMNATWDSGVHTSATDGNLSTWRAFNWSANGSAYLQLNLTSVQEISNITIYCYNDGSYYHYYVNVSEYPWGPWTQIVEKTNNNVVDADGDTYNIHPIRVRYIQIHATYHSGNSTFGLVEVTAYDPDGDRSTRVDTAAPTINSAILSYLVDNGTAWTNVANASQRLNVSASYLSDTISGVNYVWFNSNSTYTSGYGLWQVYNRSVFDTDATVTWNTFWWDLTLTTFNYNTTDGTRYICFTVNDTAGNIQSVVLNITMILDRAPPKITSVLINSGDEYAHSYTVTVSITANESITAPWPWDGATGASGMYWIYFSEDGTTWDAGRAWTGTALGPSTTNYTYNFTTGDGDRALYVMVRDNAHNNATKVGDSIILDVGAPSTSYIVITGTSGNNGWYTSNMTVNLSAQDPGGLKNLSYRILWDNGSFWPNATAYAADPTNITLYNGEYWYVSTNITSNATMYFINLTFSFTEGWHHLYYFAWDNASNKETTRDTNIKIDTIQPNATFYPELIAGWTNETNWYNQNVTVNLVLFDNATDTWVNVTYINATGVALTGWAPDWDPANATPSGIFNVTYSVWNGTGWGYYNLTNVWVALAANQWVNLSGAGLENLTPIRLLGEGNFSIVFNVTDNAGNNGTHNLSLRTYCGDGLWIRIDKTAPLLETIDVDAHYTGPGALPTAEQYTNNTWVVLNITSTYDPDNTNRSGLWKIQFSNDNTSWGYYNATGVWVANGSVNWTSGSFNTTYHWNLSAGAEGSNYNRTVWFRIYDNASNEYVANASIVFDLYKPTPQLSISPAGTYLNVAEITVIWNGSDYSNGMNGSGINNFTLQYRKDDGTGWSAWLWNYTPSASGNQTFVVVDGWKYEFRCIARDKVGWYGDYVYSNEIYIDFTPPTATSVVISDSDSSSTAWTNSLTVNLALVATDPTNTSVGAGTFVSEVYQMAFSCDGSNWSSWVAYASTSSIDLSLYGGTTADGVKTVYFKVKDNAGWESGAISDTIQLDTSIPVTTLTKTGTAGENSWYTTTVTITLASTDTGSGVSKIEYNIGAGWLVYTGPFNLTDGEYTLQYNATDVSGNVEVTQSEAIKIDTVKPAADSIIINLGDDYTKTESVNLTVSASDATYPTWTMSMSFKNEGGTWSEWTTYGTYADWTLSTGIDGSRKVYFRVKDNAGLISDPTASDTITLDKTAPETEITVPSADGTNGWYITNVTVTLTATDTGSGMVDGLAKTVYRIDGGLWTTGTSYTFTAEGTHTIEYKSTDYIGNVEDIKGPVTVKLDKTRPTSQVLTLSAYQTSSTSFTVQWTGSDATSGSGVIVGYTIQVKDGAGDWGDWKIGTLDTSATYIGTEGHTYYFRSIATDQAGNVETAFTDTGDTYTTVDTVKPTVTPTINGTVGTNGWYRSATTVTLAADETATIYYHWDTETEVEYTAMLAASEDEHTLYYRAVDLAGNEKSGSTVVKVDTGLPTSKVATLTTYQTSSISFSVSWSGSDVTSGKATYTIQVKDGAGGTWLPWKTDTIETSDTYIGTEGHTYYFRSILTDQAGNVETDVPDAGDAYTTVDTVKPTTDDDAPTVWKNTDVTVTLTPDDATATTWYKLDAGVLTQGTTVLVDNDGIHTISYYSVDVAGNIESPTKSCTVKIDTVAPTTTAAVTSGTLGENGWYTSDVIVTLTSADQTGASGVSVVNYIINSGTPQLGTTIQLTTGTYTIEFYATDNAGNIETVGAANTITVKIDKTAPTALSISIAAGADYTKSASVTLTLDATDETQLLVSNDQVTWLEYNASWTLSTGDGTKTVYLKAVDDAGNYAIALDTIILDTTAPTAIASANKYTIYKGETVLFNGAASSDTNGIASYEWDVDGVTDYTTANPSHTYTSTGTYTVTLTVTDNAGNTKTTSIEITVNKKPEPPIPGFEVLALIAAMGVAVILLRKKH